MSFCEHCTQGYVLSGEPTGSFQHVEPTGAYCKFYDGELVPPKRIAIVLLTDIFGLELKNSKLIADRLSEKCQCDVWVPDLFAGKPPMKESQVIGVFPDHASMALTIRAKLRFLSIVLSSLPTIIANRASVVDARVQTFIKTIREERQYEKIGVVGYCFGGAAAVRLSATDLIDSVVVCHPGNISLNDVRAMKPPASWVCAEQDFTFGPKLRNAAQDIYSSRKDKADFIVYEFRDYKGTVHGFAARPNLGIPDIKAAFEGALKQTCEWFLETLYHNRV